MQQRIMIFGDSASGKSTFASQLAKKTGLPLVHADELMNELGRTEHASIRQKIINEANKDNWIIEGNAFTKDKMKRIERATLIYVFDFNRFYGLINHVRRHVRVISGKEPRIGNDDLALNLRYFTKYMLFKFPPRKKAAIAMAKKLKKEIIFFRNYKDIKL